MKKTDLCPGRQKLLVPVADYPGSYSLVPPPTPRSIPSKTILSEVTRAHEALGELRAATARLPNPDLVTRTFDRREAVRSSQIEGTNAGVDELLTYEATGSSEGLPSDVTVTLNYVKALEYGLNVVRSGGAASLTCGLIKELHRHLLQGVDDDTGQVGEFRTNQNWIGGPRIYQARFVPPPADCVDGCMMDLESFLQHTPREEDMYEVPIVIRMAIAHAQFETIHPFVDGNGRVGRILLPLMLAAEGYPPVYIAGFLKNNQRMYYETLAGVQLREEWTDWVSFFADGVAESVKESISTANGLEAILTGWDSSLADLRLRSDAVVKRLPKLLIGTPVVTVRQVEAALGVSFPAANSALVQLEAMGILTRSNTQQRNRTFVAREVIELLSRPSSVA